MIRGLTIASTGMLAAQKQSEVIADNIANIKTPGYKEENEIKEPFPKMLLARLESLSPYEYTPIGERGDGVAVTGIVRNADIGLLEKTDRTEDLALTTEGFFVVDTPQGLRLTRNGHFELDANGTLRTQEGYGVLTTTGKATGLSKNFRVASDGTIIDGNTQKGKLMIVMPLADTLKREGQSLYSFTGTPRVIADAQVKQGMLERSNVDMAGQMTKMITVMRAYEANQKVIQTQDAALEKAVNEVGKV